MSRLFNKIKGMLNRKFAPPDVNKSTLEQLLENMRKYGDTDCPDWDPTGSNMRRLCSVCGKFHLSKFAE